MPHAGPCPDRGSDPALILECGILSLRQYTEDEMNLLISVSEKLQGNFRVVNKAELELH